MFDAHCHLDRCTEDPLVLLERARTAGVTDVLIAGVEATSWPKQTALAQQGVHIAWGVHPWRVAHAPQSWTNECDGLNTLLNEPPIKPVAIGEMGLDFGRRINPSTRPDQEEAFRTQIRMAKKFDLPVILHIVRAHNEAIRILKEENITQVGGLVHSFSGNPQQVEQYVRLNLHISFSGTVVDPKNEKVRKSATHVPENRLLVETDSPDQTPKTRKPLPNEPSFLIDVVAAIAAIRNQSTDQVAETTTYNARALFGTHST